MADLAVFSSRQLKGAVAKLLQLRVLSCLSIAGLSVAAPVLADNAKPDATFELGAVEVIGQREAAAAALTTGKVTFDTIAERHRDDLSEALDLVPGVAIQNTGQRRERLIALRGFSSRQVPLYIDGIPVYVPYDGNVDLARFGVDYVSEIVVSKGLASLLYGPNILGGVVNVVSRKPINPLEASARLETEIDDHFDSMDQRGSLSLGGVKGMWYGNVVASYVNSTGYRLPDSFTPVAAENGGRRENAASHDAVVSTKIGFQPDADNEYALSYYYQHGEKQDPPYAGSYLAPAHPDGVQARFWRWPYWDKQSIYFVARNAIASQGTLRWRVFNDTFQNSLESYDNATYTTQVRPFAFHGSNYNDFTYGASVDFEWNWNAFNTTRIAAHFRQDVHRETEITPFEPLEHLEAKTYDIAVEHEWQVIDGLFLTPSYSHMVQPHETAQVYNSTQRVFSPVDTEKLTADNAQLVATYHVDATDSFVAGVSNKTRFPTIKERFSGGLGSVLPNPSLAPETAVHFEVGYERKGTNWDAKIALFQSRLHDAIQSVTISPAACSVPPCTELQNVGIQRNRGVELSADYAPLDTLRLNAQVNIVDIENISTPTIQPTGTPEDKYVLAGDWQFLPLWHLRIDAQHESSRYSNSTGTRVAGGFTLVNSFVRFAPIPKLGVELGVRNLTDKLYAYEEGFYEPGRTWLAQVDYRY